MKKILYAITGFSFSLAAALGIIVSILGDRVRVAAGAGDDGAVGEHSHFCSAGAGFNG